MREENLRRPDAVGGEMLLIGLHETHLSNGGGRLKLADARGARGPAEALHAFHNGAGTHEHNLAPHGTQLGNLMRPALDRLDVDASSLVGDERAADLDDDAAGIL